MAAGHSVDSILAGAKRTLNHANHFSDSVEGPKAAAPKPTHEFSSAPYSLVGKAQSIIKNATAPSSDSVKEAGDIGHSIKTNQDNAAAVKDVMPK